MKRLVFSLVVAALAVCPLSHAAEYARSNQRTYRTSVPNTYYTSTEKSLSVSGEPVGPPPVDVYATPQESMAGYPFVDRCGRDCSPCCDHAWDGYSRGCGLAGWHSRLFGGGCGTCDSCGGHGKRLGGLHASSNCSDCASVIGGCSTDTASSACGGCGGVFGGLHGLGCRLHQFGADCRNGIAHGCRKLGLLHAHGTNCGCDESCGCTSHASETIHSDGKPVLNAPPLPPEEPAAAEQIPPLAPVPDKSANRPTFQRKGSGFFGAW